MIPADIGPMLAAVLIVAVLVGLTLTVHYEALRFASDVLVNLAVLPPRLHMVLIVFTAFAAHTIEVWIYAVGYYVFIEVLELGTIIGAHDFGFFDYLYFSTTNYTSLGFGDIAPVDHVRLIAGVEALNGLLMIAWTGSFTYLAMEKLWPLHLRRRRPQAPEDE